MKKNGDVWYASSSWEPIIDAKGKFKGAIFQTIDVTERKAVEDALKESERKYSEFFRTSRDPVFITTKDGRMVECNDAFMEALGYETMDELLKIAVPEHYENPDDKKRFNRIVEQDGFAKEFPTNLVKKDGGIINTLITATVIKDRDGGVTGFQGTIRDITDHKAAEDALKESEIRYKHLYSMVRLMCDNLPDLIWTKDLDGKFIFVNKACCDILLNAKDTDEPIGKDDMYFARRENEAHPGNPDYHTFGETCNSSDLIVMETKNPQTFDEFGNLKGEFIYLDVYKAPFWDGEHNLTGTVGCARVVTKERQAEEQIKRSLQEKEVLLREIHHRVKNNLQVVSSLLNMQARNARDKNTIEILSEARDRIKTMSLIHSQLYEGSDLAAINMKEFVNRLLGQLLQSYPVGDTRITRVVHVDDYPFPISVAVPVGLIVNELLSNALKHAFDGRDEGTIEVSLTAPEEGMINLTVSDDGVGLPPGFDIDKSKTLGLRLVKILTEDQLQGNLEVTSDGGATFRIEFETETG
jgi:PAS domain S-box-containing protein